MENLLNVLPNSSHRMSQKILMKSQQKWIFSLILYFLIRLSLVLRGITPSELSAVKCVWITQEPEDWKQEFEWCKKFQEDILDQLKENRDKTKHKMKGSKEKERKDNDELQEDLNSLDDDIKFYSSEFDLEAYISRRCKEEMSIILGLQGLLPVGVISGGKETLAKRTRLGNVAAT